MISLNADNQAGRDKAVYEAAKEYLLEQSGVTPEMLERHLSHTVENRPETLGDIYKRLVASAQNAQMMPRVIGGSIGGTDKLERVLFGFNPTTVVERYPNTPDGAMQLFDSIKIKLHPRGKLNTEARSCWPRFCRSVISGAVFLTKFKDADTFYKWAEEYDNVDSRRVELPQLIAAKVDGMGFALACDFIKDLGFYNFSKPDVHLRDILCGLGMSGSKDIELFQSVSRIAENTGKTAYDVDKLFWLVGSGNLYLDGLSVRTSKTAFITRTQLFLLQPDDHHW